MTSEKDQEAFAKAMRGVKRLRPAERAAEPKRPRAKARNSRATRSQLLNATMAKRFVCSAQFQWGTNTGQRRREPPSVCGSTTTSATFGVSHHNACRWSAVTFLKPRVSNTPD